MSDRVRPFRFLGVLLLTQGLAGPLLAAPAEGLSVEAAIRLALERDPAVAAAQSRLEAATAGVRGARAPFNLQGEVAPGVGFTNGNALLSQPFDIGGRRSAAARAATGARSAAQGELDEFFICERAAEVHA